MGPHLTFIWVTDLLGCHVASLERIKRGHWWRVSASHIWSTDKRQVVSPLLMRAGGSVSHTNTHVSHGLS